MQIWKKFFYQDFCIIYLYQKRKKNYLVDNTLARVQVIDPVRGNDIFCAGKITEDLE